MIVPDLTVNGVVVTGSPYTVRFIGWVMSPKIDGGEEERRVNTRFVMPMDAARKLWADLGALWKTEH